MKNDNGKTAGASHDSTRAPNVHIRGTQSSKTKRKKERIVVGGKKERNSGLSGRGGSGGGGGPGERGPRETKERGKDKETQMKIEEGTKKIEEKQRKTQRKWKKNKGK